MKVNDKELVMKLYPIGTKLELDSMDDPYAVPPGTKGVVKHIDDIGQIHVAWENGSSLALIMGVDKFHVI